MKGKKIRNSIAKKVTWQILLVLLVAMVALSSGAYMIVSQTVYRMNNLLSLTALDLYSDYLTEFSNDNQVPLTQDVAEDVIRYGDYICSKYGTDYVYLYMIDEESSSVTYVGNSFSEATAEASKRDHMVGRRVECEFYSDELAVWHGEKDSATITVDNSYGHEIATLTLVKDCRGNRLMAGVETSYDYISDRVIRIFSILAVMVVAVLVCIGVSIYLVVTRRISKPAEKLSRRMQAYITDGRQSEEKLTVKGHDEYAMIADAFNSMTDDIGSYVESIKALSEEQANRKAEFIAAAEIQRGFLPAPAFADNHCAVEAMMVPAKDIGGDLYDYAALGEGKYLAVIADVSGKGTAAALFMSVALTLIRQFAQMGLAPDEILTKTNDSLTERNKNMLFVTAFVGIYSSCDNTFTYANAGHNLPYKIGSRVEPLGGKAGVLLGLFPGETYESQTVPLNPGETVFLYTDGITEAVNSSRQFWGTTRLEAALSESRPNREIGLIDKVYGQVTAFADGAEQHDDITILTLTAKCRTDFTLRYDIRQWETVKGEILKLPLPRPQQLNLCLAAEEIFVNICSYAFNGAAPEGERIALSVTVSNPIELCFIDGGIPYNPLEGITTPDTGDDDFQIGGLGRFLSASLTDDARYEHRNGKNILTLIKYLEEETL